ncbi:glycosyltransferase family 2 protein [Patescibacteria group bacterium]|nr:glycosyltransferase family 2 protein [Patescibacteria group bacterium]MBU1673249.1 glycosyltransferase family 2 protein [Patescibacteria group bacterium]MBU1963510.1 glycosyltransferase family 2 protein [Patescibacteria group bacterium]
MENPKVGVVILNYNGLKHLKTCLDSVLALDYPDFEIFLVENGSNDGSLEFINDNYKDKITLIALDKNTGFAKGNNIAIKEAFKDPEIKYIAPLNNDTKVESGWLGEMMNIIRKDEKIGSVSSKMMFYYEKDLINAIGVLISRDGGGINLGYKEKDEGQFEKDMEIFGPSAGACLYSRKMLEDIDLGDGEFFDNTYFAYYEDVDICWRARLAGYTSWYSHKSVVYHVHSATGVSHSPFKAFHIQRNRLFNILKDFPFWSAVYAFLIITPVRYLHLLNAAFFRKSGPAAKTKSKAGSGSLFKLTFKAWADFFRLMPEMMRKRRKVIRSKIVSNKLVREWFKKYKSDLETEIYK